MDRIIVFLMLLIFTGCSTLSNEDNADSNFEKEENMEGKYVFHDDFYYTPGKGDGMCNLEKIQDEYFIFIDAKNLETVFTELADNDFKVIDGPKTHSFLSCDYDLPSFCKDNRVLCVKGSGNLESISDIVFHNNLYRDENGFSQIGKSNTFYVRCSGNAIDQVVRYAEQLDVFPVNYVSEYDRMCLLCTDESAGNPVEMSNWFVEEAGFEYAQPNYIEISSPWESYLLD